MAYVDEEDIKNMKLSILIIYIACRFLYYQIISRDIWTNLKWGIA